MLEISQAETLKTAEIVDRALDRLEVERPAVPHEVETGPREELKGLDTFRA